jgi:hypothetical protein
MQQRTSATPQRKPHAFALLHRYGGIVSAVLVIFICATGLALNHTDDLKLSKRTIDSRWLLDWYGIDMPEVIAYGTGDAYVSQLNGTIYLNTLPVPGYFSRLRGIITTENASVVATSEELILLNKSAELIEILDATMGVPADIRRIGQLPDKTPVIETPEGLWTGTHELLNWKLTVENSGMTWSDAVELPPTLFDAIALHYRGTGLTVERVILDLHSGRLLGRAGPLLADAAAILFIMLAMTGIWMWFRTRRRSD